MEVGDAVRLKADGRVGNIVEIKNNWAVVALPLEIPNPRYGEDSTKFLATVQEVDVDTKHLEVDFQERHRQENKRTGKVWYTDQYGEVIVDGPKST